MSFPGRLTNAIKLIPRSRSMEPFALLLKIHLQSATRTEVEANHKTYPIAPTRAP